MCGMCAYVCVCVCQCVSVCVFVCVYLHMRTCVCNVCVYVLLFESWIRLCDN